MAKNTELLEESSRLNSGKSLETFLHININPFNQQFLSMVIWLSVSKVDNVSVLFPES